jgi:hypothetical protein
MPVKILDHPRCRKIATPEGNVMIVRDQLIRGLRAAAAALCLSVLAPAVLATAASAAGLKLTLPSHVKKGARYTIKIHGSYKKNQITGRAYLISLIQFADIRCRGSAQDENQWAIRTGANIEFYFAPRSDPARGGVGLSEPKSPFDRSDTLQASSAGPRHLCTYLYPRFTHASDSTQPIARADKRYVVTRH